MTEESSTTSVAKLRRFAERSIEILGRQKAIDPAIAVFDPRLVLIATAFIAAHAASRLASNVQPAITERARLAAVALQRRCSVWLVSLERDIAGFNASQYVADQSIASDVISTATDLLQFLTTHATPDTLPTYVAQLVGEITPLLEAAKSAREEAQSSLVNLHALQATARERAATMDDELIAFRRALRAVLGPNHHDVQQLRPRPKRKTKKPEQETPAQATTTQPAPTTAQRLALGLA